MSSASCGLLPLLLTIHITMTTGLVQCTAVVTGKDVGPPGSCGVRCGVVRCGVVWCGVVRCGVVR